LFGEDRKLDFGTIRSVDDPEFTDLRAAYEAWARNREVGFALKNGLHQVSLSGPVRAKKRLMRRSKRRRYSITC
jgi:hypothetical protein